MDEPQGGRSDVVAIPRWMPPWPVVGLIAGFSILVIYCNSVAIGPLDAPLRATYRRDALAVDYRDALRGARDFPGQWRLLGIYLVYAGERLLGVDPYKVAVVVKVAFLAISAVLLFQFSRLYTTPSGSVAVLGIYFVLTMAAFQDAYSIYYCNDYMMLAGWFAAVYLIRLGRYGEAALVTFVGAWAKETVMLVPILLGVMYVRKRVGLLPVALASAAFIVPTIVLRTIFRAPLAQWAWWHMLFVNTPFLQSNRQDLLETLEYNAKVFVFLNVFWWIGIRGVRRSATPFLKDLALTLGIYIVLAYWVVFVRELRHFLPLAIVLLPSGIADFEASDPAMEIAVT
jgi:hypothetical protein